MGERLPISKTFELEGIVGKTVAQVKQAILDAISAFNTQPVPIYISTPSGTNNLISYWNNINTTIEPGASGMLVIIPYYKSGGKFYARYELSSYASDTIIRGRMMESQFV